MATFNNKIQIARGSLKTKGELAYGELFYDKGSTNLFIGKKDDLGKVEPSRVGGSDGLVLKGVVTEGTIPVSKTDEYGLIAGDTYFLSAPIFFTKDPVTGACKSVTPDPKDPQAEKNLIKWEKDSIIIYLGNIVVDNSEIVYDKWLYVNSSFLKADHVLFDKDTVDFLTGFNPNDYSTVQKALEYVFNTGMAYAGEVGEANVKYEGTIDLGAGQFVYYKGEDGSVTVNGVPTDLKENSLVICQKGAANDKKITVIPLGAASADSIGFKFTTPANYGDTETYSFKSKNADGTEATLAKEADVDTVTKAIDWLNGKKADLGANNKIPLQQIPTTLIGALQFKGTVNIDELVGALEPGLGKDHITAEELVTYIKAKLGYSDIDEGDYVIFTKTSTGDSTVFVDDMAYNSGDWAIYLPTHLDPEVMSDADHWERINASAAVDNVNGVTGSVNIAVSEELGLEVAGQNITISNKTLLDDEANVPAKHVPILDEGKMGTHVVKDSELAIDRKTPEEGLTLTDTSKSIDITMKTSGDIVTTPKGAQGTLDVLSKFDAQGSLIDSIVKNTNDDVLIGDGKNANMTIKTGTKLGIDINVGNFQNHFKFEDGPQVDAKGTSVTIDQPATLLDDASVIDCGEW